MGRLQGHRWWIISDLLTAPLMALAAAVPHIFSPGTPIVSAQVNQNFKNLADPTTALESRTATVVFDSEPGGLGMLGLSKPFTTSGGTLLVVASATAFSTVAGILDVAIELDGNVIGHAKTFTNEVASHKALPTRMFRLTGVSAGTHNLSFVPGNPGTTSDDNDFYSAAVLEVGP